MVLFPPFMSTGTKRTATFGNASVVQQLHELDMSHSHMTRE